jgi:ABC-type branched-subunit amino acid transport system substrate-binding protein
MIAGQPTHFASEDGSAIHDQKFSAFCSSSCPTKRNYDTALSIGAGAKAARQKGEVNRETMNAALATIKNLPGATGNISFQPDGDRAGSLYYLTVRGGKFVLADKQ